MAISTIQLVDTDLSTVLFDLHSADGSTNSSWGSVITKFGLGGSFKVEAPHDAERFQHPSLDGAFTTFSRRGLGTATWRQVVTASSEANLRLGVGRLTDLVTRGGILRIVTGTTTRYLRFEPSPPPKPFQGKELELHDIFQAFSFRQGLDIELACQPYWEGAEVTIGPTDVPNDPASTNGRALSVSISGDLPTPVRVRARMEGVDRALSTSAAADDIIDCTAHGFEVDQAVIFTSLTGGSGLTAGTTYYVVATSFGTNTFRVATTPGGTAINFTTDITAGTVVDAAAVQRLTLAAHTIKGLRNAAALADYQDASGYRFAQLEASGGPWTITLASEVSAASPLVEGSPGTGNTAALASHTTSPAVMKWKVRGTASSIEPLRGEWDVWLKCFGADAVPFEARLAWGLTTSPPFFNVNPTVTFTPGTSLSYTEQYLGPISIPTTGTLAGFGWEVQTACADGVADDLYLDHLWFVSRDQQGTVVVASGATETQLGKNLASAVSNPGGGTAGTVSGNYLLIDTTTDTAGMTPNTGVVLTAGHYRAVWHVQNTNSVTSATLRFVVRNITTSADMASQTLTFASIGNRIHEFSTEWDADGTSAYQVQVDDWTGTGSPRIVDISYQYIPAIRHDQSILTDPQAPAAYSLNSSAAITGEVGVEGAVPLVLQPGTNIVAARALEVPLVGFTDPESRRQRQMALTLTYFPRYAF